MVLEDQDEHDPDILPNDLFDDELEDDWFNIHDVLDIYIDKEDY